MATVVQKRRRRTRKLTEAEFMRLPDDGRKYELVDGEAKEAPTSLKHGVIGMWLAFLLMPHLSDKAYFTGAQAGYRTASGNIPVPDVGVILKQSLPDGKLPDGFGDRAPDLAIEIVLLCCNDTHSSARLRLNAEGVEPAFGSLVRCGKPLCNRTIAISIALPLHDGRGGFS